WTARHLTRAAAVKFVATAHRPTRAESWAGRRMEAAQAQADRVIAVSDFVARDIAARHAPPDGRLVTIRAGINLDRFNPATVRAERVIKLASQWRLPDDRRVVLFPGRLTENRGQRRLIEAVRALGRSDIYCLLVGAGDPPSSFESTLKRDIETAGLGGIVGLAPYCADMPAAYMLADVVVAGGGGQGFSRIIVEAQAMSRPVVCDADGGAVEGMVPDETGWAAASDDPAALARALDTALGLSPERRAVLSHRAQRHVRENFTTEAMCRRTLELYADVLDRAPAHAAA
ncbi:MAG: glycosyltransferase, partial [Rhodospirillales bacterium]|nr:glycosyltransferase [Rhodospirillales bacterium]